MNLFDKIHGMLVGIYQCDGCGQDFKTTQLNTNNFFEGLYCDYCNEMEDE